MRRLLIGSAMTLVMAGYAAAADLPVYTPVYTKATPPFSWTGFYIGANGGYGWGSSVGTITYTTNLGATDTSAGPGGATGWFGGGQIGYNWQTGPFVLGVEADIQDSGIKNGAQGLTTGGLQFAAGQRFGLVWHGARPYWLFI